MLLLGHRFLCSSKCTVSTQYGILIYSIIKISLVFRDDEFESSTNYLLLAACMQNSDIIEIYMSSVIVFNTKSRSVCDLYETDTYILRLYKTHSYLKIKHEPIQLSC